MLIYKQAFFSLSTVVCLSPPSNIQRSFKVREKEKRIFILFLFIYLWNFVHRLKIAPVVYYKRTPYIYYRTTKTDSTHRNFCVWNLTEKSRETERISVQPISSLYFRVENTMRQMEMATSSLKTETTIALSQSMDSVNTNPEEEVSACQLFIFQTPPPPLLQNSVHLSPFPHPQTKKKLNYGCLIPTIIIPLKKWGVKDPPLIVSFTRQPPPTLPPPPSNSPHPCCTITPLPWKKKLGILYNVSLKLND